MDISDVVDHVSGDLREGVAASLEVADPASYASQWWHSLGTDARVNALIVADHLEQVLPDDLRDFRRIVREHSAVAPVNVVHVDGRTSTALLYCIVEDGESLDEWEYDHFFLGGAPASSEVTRSSLFYGSLGGAFEDFYSQVHNGFAVDIGFDGGGILAVENLGTWNDRTGDGSPNDLSQSLLGEEPYIPDPNQMVIVFRGGGDTVFFVLDHPKDNWQYSGGSFFFYPELSKSGRRITPMVLIERAILYSYLDYTVPMPFE